MVMVGKYRYLIFVAAAKSLALSGFISFKTGFLKIYHSNPFSRFVCVSVKESRRPRVVVGNRVNQQI